MSRTSSSSHPDRLRFPRTPAHAGLRPSGSPTGVGCVGRSGLRSRAEEALVHAEAAPPVAPVPDRRVADPAFALARHLWLEEELFFRVVRDAIDETDYMDVETIVEAEPRGSDVEPDASGRTLRFARRVA